MNILVRPIFSRFLQDVGEIVDPIMSISTFAGVLATIAIAGLSVISAVTVILYKRLNAEIAGRREDAKAHAVARSADQRENVRLLQDVQHSSDVMIGDFRASLTRLEHLLSDVSSRTERISERQTEIMARMGNQAQ